MDKTTIPLGELNALFPTHRFCRRGQDLTGRWKKAKDAEERQSAARQKASAISVSDPSIMAIREAVKEVDKLSAQLKASATLIFFDLNPGAHENVSVNDHFLDQEKTSVQVYEVTTILIPERGKITVDPAARDQDKLLQKLKVAKAELKKHLIGVGVATSDEAEEQYLLRKKLLQDAEMARQETELHAPATGEIEAGAQALFDHIQGLATNLEREKEVLGLEKLPTRVEAESILDFTKAQAEKHRESLQLIQDSIRDQQAKVDQLTIGLAKALAGHEEAEKRLKKLQLQLKRLEAESASKALVEAIKIAKTDVLAQEKIISDLEGQRTGETLPLLETRIKRLENTIQERGDKRSNLKAEIAGLKAKIMMAEGEGLDETIARKNREVALGEEDVRRLEREVKILTLLLATLREAEQQAKERYLSPVLKRVRPYLQILFPNSDIILDHNLHITGVMRERSYEEAFEHLSMGTQEQIAVLIRLAFAEMLVDQGQPATVVLDDSLVFSDDHRIRRMFDILNHASRKVQVLVLTCREQLFEELGGRTLSLKPGNADDLLSA